MKNIISKFVVIPIYLIFLLHPYIFRLKSIFMMNKELIIGDLAGILPQITK